jgi:hypothetical protein
MDENAELVPPAGSADHRSLYNALPNMMNGADDRETRQEVWDRFIDDLDRAGQAGSAANVEVPLLAPDLPTGKRFGDLTRVDVENLSRLATSLGRRTDVVTVLWQDMERKRKAGAKAAKPKKKR